MGRHGRPHPVAVAPAPRLPLPARLAALGPVLCLYRACDGSELAGWTQAVRTTSRCEVDSDCLHEVVHFHDGQDACCWRLCLLPDSDFLAWERLTAGLPIEPAPPSMGVGQRLWSRLAQRLRGGQWQASLLRFHLRDDGFGLGATLTAVSPLGMATARRLARLEGLEDWPADPADSPPMRHSAPHPYMLANDSHSTLRPRPMEHAR